MNDKPVSFRVCDFSEQIVPASARIEHPFYSAVMHVDGKVYEYKYALRHEFCAPLSALRSDAWLNLLEQIAEAK